MSLAVEERVARGRSLGTIQVLLEHGTAPDQRGNHQWKPVRRLTDDVGAPYWFYEIVLPRATPLMAAVVAGDLPPARMLLEFGADPSARNAYGKTPVDHAREAGNEAMLSLLEHGTGRSAER